MDYKSWNNHYKRDRSSLAYPDENLVRILKKSLSNKQGNLIAVDLGCGSGRHLQLLHESGLDFIIGTDIAYNALASIDNTTVSCLQCNNKKIPFKNDSIDLIIAWGSLHYGTKDDSKEMITEIFRVLKKDAHLLATLRSDTDTYLKKGNEIGNNVWITDLKDINGSTVSFYNEDEVINLFNSFTSSTHGYMERSIMGDTSKVISHWIIDAVK